MKAIFTWGVVVGSLIGLLLTPIQVRAQEIAPVETFYRAKVMAITDEGVNTDYGMNNPYQTVVVQFSDGDMAGQQLTIQHGGIFMLSAGQLVRVGDEVVVLRTPGTEEAFVYQIIDKYRINRVIPLILAFFLAIILLSGWKGVGSIVGMIMSLIVIVRYIVPQILAGNDPLAVSIVGCLVIMVTTIYLAHGFSKKTSVALLSTGITLVGTGILAHLFVTFTHLTGLGTEDAYSLMLGPTAHINFKGLLLGGILIGTLGVLDDITTGLSASVFELAKANPKYSSRKLFAAGLSIGQEHIASLVNTLVLAYAGVALPIFLILILNPSQYPLWTILNGELLMEEMVRTLAGSIGLVTAVPLTTFLAVMYIKRGRKKS